MAPLRLCVSILFVLLQDATKRHGRHGQGAIELRPHYGSLAILPALGAAQVRSSMASNPECDSPG